MKKLVAIVAVIFVTMTAEVLSFEMIEARSIGQGRTVDLMTPSPTELLRAPSDQFGRGEWQVETGYHRRFELSDLDDLFIAGAYRRERVTVAFGASQFGNTDLYAEQLLRGVVMYHYREFTAAGYLSAMNIEIGNGYGGLRAATPGLGVGYTGTDFCLALSWDNFTRPRLVENGRQTEPVYTLSGQLFRDRGYSFLGRVRWEAGEKPQFGLAQTIRVHPKAEIFWGVGTEPLEYGGGLEITLPFGALTYATSVHPTLGFSHTVTLSFFRTDKSGETGDGFD